jgi:hypothetical protein
MLIYIGPLVQQWTILLSFFGVKFFFAKKKENFRFSSVNSHKKKSKFWRFFFPKFKNHKIGRKNHPKKIKKLEFAIYLLDLVGSSSLP